MHQACQPRSLGFRTVLHNRDRRFCVPATGRARIAAYVIVHSLRLSIDSESNCSLTDRVRSRPMRVRSKNAGKTTGRAAYESLPKVGIVERSCPRSIRRNVAVDRPIPGYGRLLDVLDCEVIDI